MTNLEWAEAIIRAYRAGAKSGRFIWTYGEMAIETGRNGQHRLMGPALDLVRDYCMANGLPDCASMIVTRDELLGGTMKPSEAALAKHGGWPELRRQQAACLTFHW